MKARWTTLMAASLCAAVFALAGCSGDDGDDGAPGPAGDAGLACWDLNENGEPDLVLPDPPFTEDLNGDGVINVDDCNGLIGSGDPVSEAVAAAKPESCNTCHGGVGDAHQSEYDDYVDTTLAMEITSATSAPGAAGGFDVTVEFSVTKDGAAFDDLASLESCSFYIVQYDSATGEFVNPNVPGAGFASFPSLSCANATSNGAGAYTLLQNLSYDPLAVTGGAIMGTLGNGLLEYESKSFAARVRMYADLAPAAFVFGDYGAFESVANVAACQRCHSAPSSDGTLAPYRKHANFQATVDGAPDFSVCRGCHRDDATGGHPEWQWMVDDPLAWGTAVNFGDPGDVVVPDDVAAGYAYDRNLFNDVHMSHAMDLAYPQSMANCDTCHNGKLDLVLDNTNFVPETCLSCHPVEGLNAWPETVGGVEEGDYAQPHRAPPLEYLWAKEGVTFHDIEASANCQGCHGAGVARPFNAYHTGYDPRIYTADGTPYRDLYSVSINAVTVDTAANTITVEFSGTDPAIVPQLGVGFYGWDSKDFLVSQHTRGTDRERMEYVPESSCPDPDPAECANPMFTEAAASAPGAWVVTLDYSAYQNDPALIDDIPTLIENGDVKKIEVTLEPELAVDGQGVALNAVNQTVDIATSATVANYFKDEAAIADVTKCNNCHDQLAVTFHFNSNDGSGRGGSITQCRACHVTTNGGSHLEMQSRSITSYVHAIHTMQYFDTDEVDFADPVEDARYKLHIEEFFPVFTAQACEACHEPGVFNVPDQSKSMPALLSKSFEVNVDRNIGMVPEYVTGPASMSCGGCHRAELINEDAAGALTSFNAHTQAFGTYVENDDDASDSPAAPADEVLYGVIYKIMSMFK